MNALQRFVRQTSTSLKAFAMAWGGRVQTWHWGTPLGRTNRTYAAAVGDGRGNSIIVACLNWLCRTFPEAPLVLFEKRGTEREPILDHPLLDLLEHPNDYYSGELLWSATVADWMLGNAYWLKVRSGARRVVQLWWVPSSMMEPRWPDNGSAFISHYDYTVNGRTIRVETTDVVHFRNGIDPDNIRKGLSPIGSLTREIYTDDEGANYSASLLSNLGIPGLLVSPDTEDGEITQPEADRMKIELEQKFGGDNRGRTAVFGSKVRATVLSFSPQQMATRDLRRIPEERVTAVFGVAAVVVGLGAGLDRSTFANFAEAREAAYEGTIIPGKRLLLGVVRTQLLPDFSDPKRYVLEWDYSGVRVLQEDQDKLHARIRENVRAGLLTINEGRQVLGFDQAPDGDVWLLPSSVAVTPAGQLGAPPPEPEPLPALLPAPRAIVEEVLRDESEEEDRDRDGGGEKARTGGVAVASALQALEYP